MTVSLDTSPTEPLLNIPPLTLGLGAILLAVHLARQFIPFMEETAVTSLVFIPAYIAQMPWTLLSYALLHFGWLHFGINMAGLIAFGSGVERLFGKVSFCAIFLGGTLSGALTHLALFPDSLTPLGGASAGISALFGALLPLLSRGRALFAAGLIFVVTNIVIGMMGMPNDPGAGIAWQAHLGGFAFGLIFALLKKRSPGAGLLQD